MSLSEADKKQSNLLNSILEFNNKAKPRSKADKEKKIYTLYEGRELNLNAYKIGMFSLR